MARGVPVSSGEPTEVTDAGHGTSDEGRRADGVAGAVARGATAVPVSFVVLLAATVALVQAAGVVGLRPLASGWGSAGVVLLAVVPAVWAGVRVARRTQVLPLALLPAALLPAYGLAAWLLPDGRRVEWFLGGDHVRHLVFVAEEGASGRLSYADQSYPRAWHTVVAAVWRAVGGRLDANGLSSLIDVMATLSWLLPAVLVVATATLTTSLALAVGLGRRPAAWAAVLASSALLLPVFLGNYQALGFENSYVAAIVTTVAARELVAQRAGLATVLVCAACAVVCAHAWQLLLPGAGLALVVVTWRRVGASRAIGRLVPVLLVWVVGLVVAWPALVALLGDIGLGHATDSDVEAPYSLLLLVSGVATSVGLALVVPRARLRGFAVLVALPVVTALALVVAVGVGIGDYYPSKLLWHTSALGLASTAVAGALGARRVVPSIPPRVRPVARAAAGAVGGLFLLLAAASPLGAFVGAWSTAHGSVVRAAVTSPGAAEAQVVWLGSAGDDTIGRILLDFYRVPTTSERTPQPLLEREEECALLRAADRPAVLSNRPEATARARYGCAPTLRVVPVR